MFFAINIVVLFFLSINFVFADDFGIMENPPQQSRDNSILIIRAGFLSQTNNQVFSTCDLQCINEMLFGTEGVNAFLEQQSNGKMAFDMSKSKVATVQLGIYASKLGCISSQWMTTALNKLGLPNLNQYNFIMLITPASAGGGSCYNTSGRGWVDPASKRRYSFLRVPSTKWMLSALANSLGLYAYDLNSNANDWSDPTGVPWNPAWPNPPSNPLEAMWGFNAPHLKFLGWLPNEIENTLQIGDKVANANANIESISQTLTAPHAPSIVKFGPYWISLRTASGADSDLPVNWGNRLYVHKVDTNGESHLVNTPLSVGQTFVDADYNSIKFASLGEESASVQMQRCIKNPPTLSFSPMGSGKVKVSVKNNDKNCPIPTYRMDAKCEGIACSINSPSPSTPLEVSLKMVLDFNYLEVSYKMEVDNQVVLQGSPDAFPPVVRYEVHPNDIGRDFKFTMSDSGGDGICCNWGGGTYYELKVGDALIRRGGKFTFQEVSNFRATPTIMQSVPATSSFTISHETRTSAGQIVVTLTQINPDGQSNGRAVVISRY